MTLGNNAAKEARQQHAWAGFLLAATFLGAFSHQALVGAKQAKAYARKNGIRWRVVQGK